MDVAQDPIGDGIAAVDVFGSERREGVMIALTRPLYELVTHASPRLFAARSAASPSMEPPGRETFTHPARRLRPGPAAAERGPEAFPD
jgi:hypothetical protein